MRCRMMLALLAVVLVTTCRDGQPTSPPHVRFSVTTASRVTFATIGDFGDGSTAEADVARLVRSWNPDHVLTLGDNNYDKGEATTIDGNIGQFYHSFIYPYQGSYGSGATTNRFWPSLGNHDYQQPGAMPYLDYFTLPGNERYYDMQHGPVHFFALNSNHQEPDGNTSASAQADWLKATLAASTAPWKVVYFHHPPYSSGKKHGSTEVMQWPFQEWGADLVIAGHDHSYERLMVKGIPFIVNGLGGKSLYEFGEIQPGSVVRYNADYGAQLVEATSDSMTLAFYSRTGFLVDSYTMTNDDPPVTTTISFQNGALPAPQYASNTDVYIAENSPITNSGEAPTLLMDGSNPAGLDKRALLKWNISAIPSNATVTAASITLYVVDTSSQAYQVYEVKRAWSESATTWTQYAAGGPWTLGGADASEDRGSDVLGTVVGSRRGETTAPLNDSGLTLVQGWVNGSVRNRGVMIMNAENVDGLDVASSEAVAVAARPKLTVTYNVPAGDSTITATVAFQNGALPATSYSGNVDTYLSENQTSTNYGGAMPDVLVIDGSDPLGQDKRALLKWDVSAIPSTATIVAAGITLNVVEPSPEVYEVYQLKRRWTESSATWTEFASRLQWTTPGADDPLDRGDTVLGRFTRAANGSYTIELNDDGVALVQGWVDRSIPNHGIIIMDTNNTNGMQVSSSEATPVSSRPMLTVTYR